MAIVEYKKLFGLFVAALAASGCTMPYREPQITSRGERHVFPGLAHILDQWQSADVMVVHGMCTHDEEWANRSLKSLATELGFAGKLEVERVAVEGSLATVHRTSFAVAGGSVRASAIVWSPITARLKSKLCFDQTDKSPACAREAPAAPAYPYQRATLNRQLKDGLLDDCLADALIYQGRSRDVISEQIQRAIPAAIPQRPETPSPAPLTLITDSLGSKVAFDALYRLASGPESAQRTAAERAIDRIALVFMRANQLPILALADESIGPITILGASGGYPSDPLAAVLGRKRILMSTQFNKVVAFTDPNDLLSYILTPSSLSGAYELIDVIVSNQPTYAGFLERPDLAHTTYSSNPAVMRLIACGSPASASCRK